MILVELAQASPSVAAQLLPRIRAWLERVLEGQLDPANEEKVGHATTFVLQHGSPDDRESLRTRAQSKLQQSPSPQEILFWLPILMQTVNAD